MFFYPVQEPLRRTERFFLLLMWKRFHFLRFYFCSLALFLLLAAFRFPAYLLVQSDILFSLYLRCFYLSAVPYLHISHQLFPGGPCVPAQDPFFFIGFPAPFHILYTIALFRKAQVLQKFRYIRGQLRIFRYFRVPQLEYICIIAGHCDQELKAASPLGAGLLRLQPGDLSFIFLSGLLIRQCDPGRFRGLLPALQDIWNRDRSIRHGPSLADLADPPGNEPVLLSIPFQDLL